jgi:transcriptional regulatory protein RtcR
MDNNSRKPIVLISLLGPVLDNAKYARRWKRWRPSVNICSHPELEVDQYHLLFEKRYEPLAQTVMEDVAAISPETKMLPHLLEFRNAWDFEMVYTALLDFAAALDFSPETHDYFVHITTGTHVVQICLFLLTESRHFPGKLIQTSPPNSRERADENLKGHFDIIDLDLAKYDGLATRFAQRKLDDISFLKSGINTRNAAFNSLIEKIETVAIRSKDPILLAGPTGAGKSQLARRIFELKKSYNLIEGNFVEMNCATLRGDGAMSALFGHTRGAFTGAETVRVGLLKTADRGMCFLDEIAELGLDEQAMLLRAIEDKTFLPVGSDREVGSDFTLICGSNKDLKSQVKAGLFREDLLARINLWTFKLPRLRDRREDIEPNLSYELERYSNETGRRVSINKEARKHFLDFAASPEALWESNFRDLNAAVRRMATLSPEGRITVSQVKDEIERLKDQWFSLPEESLELPVSLADLDLFDQLTLSAVIEECRKYRSLSEAGRALFQVSREKKKNINDSDRLRKYLLKYRLTWKDIVE